MSQISFKHNTVLYISTFNAYITEEMKDRQTYRVRMTDIHTDRHRQTDRPALLSSAFRTSIFHSFLR